MAQMDVLPRSPHNNDSSILIRVFCGALYVWHPQDIPGLPGPLKASLQVQKVPDKVFLRDLLLSVPILYQLHLHDVQAVITS